MVGKYLDVCPFWSVLRLLASLTVSLFFCSQQALFAQQGGVPAARAENAELRALPESVRFTDVPVGETYTQAVRISNVSLVALQVTEITTSNVELRITGILPPVVIAPGTSESFTVAYKAHREGQMDGEVRIVTSSAREPMILRVSAGAVNDRTELTASEAAITFEDTAVGSSGKKELMLKNIGLRDLKISTVTVSGVGFSASLTGGVTLGAGQEIAMEVTFAPKNEGRHTGEVIVTNTAGEVLVRIPLMAAGSTPSLAAVRLNWEQSPVSVEGYVVYRSAEPSGPFVRVTAGIAATEYIDTGLAAGHTYYYVVTALGADQGETEQSMPISAVIPVA